MYGLDERRDELLNFVNTVPERQAAVKPGENQWSILEVLEHLYLMEQLIVYQINQAITQGDVQAGHGKAPSKNNEQRL